MDNVQYFRNRPELYVPRLRRLIERTKRGEMYGAWNDGGRLADDE